MYYIAGGFQHFMRTELKFHARYCCIIITLVSVCRLSAFFFLKTIWFVLVFLYHFSFLI